MNWTVNQEFIDLTHNLVISRHHIVSVEYYEPATVSDVILMVKTFNDQSYYIRGTDIPFALNNLAASLVIPSSWRERYEQGLHSQTNS